ncbi:MAG: hypothetical protein ACE5H9_15430 [Anaerolineae bacterium]
MTAKQKFTANRRRLFYQGLLHSAISGMVIGLIVALYPTLTIEAIEYPSPNAITPRPPGPFSLNQHLPEGLSTNDWMAIQQQLVFTSEVAKLTANDAAAGDQFGYFVAVSGDTAVVGAPKNDDQGELTGSAYVFERDYGGTDNWGQVKKLVAADATAFDWFGFSVAISGDTVVVGAFGDNVGNLISPGSAYVFERDYGGTDNWGQVKKLNASGPEAHDGFGYSVAISNDIVAIGVPDDSHLGTSAAGSVHIFERNQGGVDNWGPVKVLIADDAAKFAKLGWSVAISGDTVIAGAYRDSDTCPPVSFCDESGAAYIFERNQGGVNNWGQVVKLTSDDIAPGDRFGWSVGISGNFAVVGAPADQDRGTDTGSVYIFERDHGGADNWGQVKKLIANDAAMYDIFGYALSIAENSVVVGAWGKSDAGSSSGAAYVFQQGEAGVDDWNQVAKLTASDAAAGDVFGWSVAISNNTAVIGAPYDADDGSDSGSAYVFQVTQLQSDLAIAKTTSPTTTILGQPLTYTLSFSNSGTYTATGVVITDVMSVSVTVNTVTSSGVTITDTGISPAYVWQVQDLPPSSSGIITITGVVTQIISGTIINTANIGANAIDANPNNNSATVETIITSPNEPERNKIFLPLLLKD